MVQVANIHNGKPYNWPTHSNDLILDRKHCQGSEAFLTTIQPGKATHRHMHEDNEQVYVCVSGKGRITFQGPTEKNETSREFGEDDLVFIPLNTWHQVACVGNEPLKYVTIDVFPKGKPAHEPTWDDHAKALERDTKKQY